MCAHGAAPRLRLHPRVLDQRARVGGQAAHRHADVVVHLGHLLYAPWLLRGGRAW